MAEKNENAKTFSRRSFLKGAGLAVGGLVVGGVVGSSLKKEKVVTKTEEKIEKQIVEKVSDYNQALMYFNQEQYQVVEAAVERIFPQDENGPGAKELGAAFFIDHQLAGSWGINARDYMQPPFYPGEPTQGYQGRLKNHEIFDLGVQGLQDASMQKYNKKFNELGPEEQDAVLTSFEKGEIRVKGIDSAHFFALLRDLTIQGVYADPMYGGNKNMEGWKMKNYPGNQGSYTDIIDKDEFAKIDPKSLKDHLS